MSAGRPSKLQDPTVLRLVSELFAAGASRQTMCDELGIKDKDTITRYRRDPRVKSLVQKLNIDRVSQISRKIDAVIEGKLAYADTMSVQELISIRKEYGGAAMARTEQIDDAAVVDAMKAAEDNPDLLADIEKLLSAGEGAEAPTEQE